MRWFCRGRVVEREHEEFEMWLGRMGKELEGARAVILLEVWKVSGYSPSFFHFSFVL